MVANCINCYIQTAVNNYRYQDIFTSPHLHYRFISLFYAASTLVGTATQLVSYGIQKLCVYYTCPQGVYTMEGFHCINFTPEMMVPHKLGHFTRSPKVSTIEELHCIAILCCEGVSYRK